LLRDWAAAGQNPLGHGAGLAKATSACSLYLGFQEKAKENRRAARIAAMLNLFSHRWITKDYKTR
jgi:hypothetical protein